MSCLCCFVLYLTMKAVKWWIDCRCYPKRQKINVRTISLSWYASYSSAYDFQSSLIRIILDFARQSAHFVLFFTLAGQEVRQQMHYIYTTFGLLGTKERTTQEQAYILSKDVDFICNQSFSTVIMSPRVKFEKIPINITNQIKNWYTFYWFHLIWGNLFIISSRYASFAFCETKGRQSCLQ